VVVVMVMEMMKFSSLCFSWKRQNGAGFVWGGSSFSKLIGMSIGVGVC